MLLTDTHTASGAGRKLSCSRPQWRSCVCAPTVARRGVRTGSAAAPTSTFVGDGSLTAEQVEQFYQDGFLVLPGFASADEVAALRKRAEQLVDTFDPASISIFSTRNQAAKSDRYFLESARDIHFFFEEKAFADAAAAASSSSSSRPVLQQAKALSINKMGHALHDLDPVFRQFSRCSRVAAVLRSLGYQRPLPMQSMYIFKQPKIGGEVVPHQDSSFLHTDPLSVVGLWWALEDADTNNGCLWGLKGSHRQGLARRFKTNEEGVVSFDRPAPSYDLSDFTALPCTAGTLVLLHGENVHYSAENTSPISRHSYAMHIVEGTAAHRWSADNWLKQAPGQAPWEPLYQEEGWDRAEQQRPVRRA